ncbi:MAG TPA: histidine kinase dimerization/phospho-acceptor domain-containing protein [Oculatellaceae cyanobacterium]
MFSHLQNLMLIQKILLLFTIPVVLQVYLFIGWHQLQQSVDKTAFELNETSSTYGAVAEVVLLTLAQVQRVIGMLNNHHPALASIENDRDRLKEWLIKLTEQWHGFGHGNTLGPEQIDVTKIGELIDALSTLVQKAETEIETDKQISPQMESQLTLSVHQVIALCASLPKFLTDIENPALQLSVEENLINCFASGVLLNMCLMVMIFFMFNNEMRIRLDLVLANVLRFREDRSVLPAQSGEDEVAQLDRAFHSMAQQILELTRKQQAIIRGSRDVLCALSEEGRIISVNEAATRLWGYEPRYLQGALLSDFLIQGEKKFFAEKLNSSLGATWIAPFDLRILRSDGSESITNWSAKWSEADSAFICVAHDVTALRAAQQFREGILQMVGHDLRNPLSSIRGFHLMLESGMVGALRPEAAQPLIYMSAVTSQMLNLVNDLLNLEKIAAGMWTIEKKLFTACNSIEKALKNIAPEAAAAQVEIKVIKMEDSKIFADETVIVLAVTNMLRLMINRQRRLVPTQKEPRDDRESEIRLYLSAAKQSASFEISVFDDSEPVDIKTRSSFFDHLGRADEEQAVSQTYTDDSLAAGVLKALVSLHGGTVGLDREVCDLDNQELQAIFGHGCGNRLWLSIPQSDPAEPPASETAFSCEEDDL